MSSKGIRSLSPCILLLVLSLLPLEKTFTDSAAQPETHQWKISGEQERFLDTLERDTFRFFWDTTNKQNGLTPDRFPGPRISSIAGVGFALTSYLVGVERGYITRAQAAGRTLTTLKFLWRCPQGPDPTGATGYKGFFYHFLNIQNGKRVKNVELSTIDTALLMAGVLSSGTYFDADNDTERRIRKCAEALYRRVEWDWAYSSRDKPLISMGWFPDSGLLPYSWSGYNEGMILYILALASPTHAVESDAWDRWTSTYHWDTFHGYQYVNFGPLFGHQYSHIWIDFRNIQDRYMRSRGIDYFINSRRATYANRAYCIENPKNWRGYTDLVWGLTASDGPLKRERQNSRFHSYWARGCSTGYLCDDGTIAPTAAGGSVAFAPEITIPTLEYIFEDLGPKIYGRYGFRDAFNLSYQSDFSGSEGWFDKQYLAIDQGPILMMIENYRTGFIWNLMKKNRYIAEGLRRAGFRGGWLDGSAVEPERLAAGHMVAAR